jgi:hypothetical protein
MPNRDMLHRLVITVEVYVDTDEFSDVIENLDYEFTHPNIKDTEIIDVDWS